MSSKLPTTLTPPAIKVIFSILYSLPIPTKVYELTIDSALNITEKDSITEAHTALSELTLYRNGIIYLLKNKQNKLKSTVIKSIKNNCCLRFCNKVL